MILNLRKELFSMAYVRAIAAMADCSVTRVEVDVNGYDITISATDEHNFTKSPTIQVQMKCTARDLLRETGLSFPLDVATYGRGNLPQVKAGDARASATSTLSW